MAIVTKKKPKQLLGNSEGYHTKEREACIRENLQPNQYASVKSHLGFQP